MEISLKNDVGITYSSYWIRDPLNQITYGSSSNDILTIEKVSSHGVEVRVINLWNYYDMMHLSFNSYWNLTNMR